MVLAISEKAHKPKPTWYEYANRLRFNASYEELCGFLNPESAPGQKDLEQRCNRAAALKWFWTQTQPSFDVWCTLNDMATHPDSCATEDQMWTQTECLKKWETSEDRMKVRRRWRDRSLRKKERNTRRRWKKLRTYVWSHIIVLMFWIRVAKVAKRRQQNTFLFIR